MTPSHQARALVLSRIRAGLGVAGRDRAREAAVEERLRAHPRGTIPARAHASREALIELMTTMLAAQGAEVTRAATPEDAVRTVAEDLRNHNLPSRLRMGADTQLAALPWDRTPQVELVFGPAGRASNHAGSYDWPRTVNLISGPSRTADIEQTIVRGAHGPKRLHVVILG